MNGVRLSFLHICRLASNQYLHRTRYCTALKPEIQTSINCFDILSKGDLSTSVDVNQIDCDKTNNKSSTSIKEILDKVSPNEFSIPLFAKTLNELRMQLLQQSGESKYLKTNGKLKELCNVFADNCQVCSPFLLMSVLRSILTLNIDVDINVIKTIESTMLQKIDKFHCHDLVEYLLLQCRTDVVSTQKDVVNILLTEIPNKLHELNSGSVVFKLLRVYDRFDKMTKKKIDFKLAELVGEFSPHYLCKLLCLLAGKQNRNKTVLQAVSYSLQQNESKPNLKQTVDILYALNSLNFPDSSLLLYLTEGRTSEICTVDQPSVISSLLTSCGHLRWHHKEILEACSKWITNNLSVCSSREFVSYILTAATLNFSCESSDATLKAILPLLIDNKISINTVWLDVVWSLSILGHADKQMLLGVLTNSFHAPLLDGSDFRVTSNKLKLMNLKSVLKKKHPECIFSCDLFLDSLEIPRSSEVENCKRSVLDAMGNFIPPGKSMRANLCTDMGICIDAEFVVDSKGKPLPLTDKSKMKSNIGRETLPHDARRIAVLVLTHKDFTLNEKHITGIISLTMQLLRKDGYTVVLVPYNEFTANVTTVKKAHYLQKEILSAIQRDSSCRKNVLEK